MHAFFHSYHLRRVSTFIAVLLLLFAAGASLAFGEERDSAAFLDEPLRLRAQIESQDGFLRFGDVFSNAGVLSQTVLTRAPEPGRIVSLDPAWLSGKAKAQGRPWQNLSSLKRVTVGRAGRRIGTEQIRTLISQELGYRADGARYEIALSNRAQTLFTPLDAMGEPRILSLDITQSNDTFSARIMPYENGSAVEVKGRLWRLTQVPALIEPLRANEELLADNVQWIDVRENRVRPGTLMDSVGLQGMAAKRALRAGQALRTDDLKRPATITKGEIITITYAVRGIRLSSQGRALADAALGAPLRVVNLHSNRTIDVVVTAPGLASASATASVGG